MTIWVDDISRYDGTAADLTADRCDEAIFNVEDPGCAEKVRRWSGEFAKPWHLYGWEYPGAGSAVDLLSGMVDQLGMAPKAGWVDYEQNGVTPTDAAAARAKAAAVGFPCGFYTYLYLLNAQDGLADEWAAWDLRWIAYYPGTNDGSYPGWAIGDAQQRGAVLWQYTSTNGTRDRNVVVDEAKWASLASTATISPTVEDTMYGKDSKGTYYKDTPGAWVTLSKPEAAAVYAALLNGAKLTILDLGDPLNVVAANAQTIADLGKLGLVPGTVAPAPAPVDLSEVQAAFTAAAAALARAAGK